MSLYLCRVALTPAAVAALIKKGFSINVEDGAGLESRFRNEDYAAAGATVVDKNTAFHSGYSTLWTAVPDFLPRIEIMDARVKNLVQCVSML
jgi:NAD/NADP transhydrogenase alpha subunit